MLRRIAAGSIGICVPRRCHHAIFLTCGTSPARPVNRQLIVAIMKIEVRTFNAGDYATAFRLWESSEGVGLSEADSPEGITKYLNRNPASASWLSTANNSSGPFFVDTTGGAASSIT